MSKLQTNTTDLQSILATVNTLPDKTDLTPIADALIDKGQTVPDNAGVDELADLIAAIEAGGGGGFSGTPTAGDTPVAVDLTAVTVSQTTETDTNLSYVVPKTGTYRFQVIARSSSSYNTGGNSSIYVYLYKNGESVVSNVVSSSTSVYSNDIACSEGDIIKVYAKGYSPSSWNTTSVIINGFLVCINWDNGF